jgi:MarR-like DNA-binding transcriptional regulator SgrR of sgrS sRNA
LDRIAAESSETAYASEKALLDERRIIPLFHLPEIYGLGPRVRGWAPSRWGGWNLASVWLAP